MQRMAARNAEEQQCLLERCVAIVNGAAEETVAVVNQLKSEVAEMTNARAAHEHMVTVVAYAGDVGQATALISPGTGVSDAGAGPAMAANAAVGSVGSPTAANAAVGSWGINSDDEGSSLQDA